MIGIRADDLHRDMREALNLLERCYEPTSEDVPLLRTVELKDAYKYGALHALESVREFIDDYFDADGSPHNAPV